MNICTVAIWFTSISQMVPIHFLKIFVSFLFLIKVWRLITQHSKVSFFNLICRRMTDLTFKLLFATKTWRNCQQCLDLRFRGSNWQFSHKNKLISRITIGNYRKKDLTTIHPKKFSSSLPEIILTTLLPK